MQCRSLTAIGLAGLIGLAGCGPMRERRWDGCAIAGGLIGAAVGGGTAGGLVNAYGEGNRGQANAGETAGAAAGGAIAGAALGTVLGHLICDPKNAPPPPPPAPPPPPPPPPPPTPKRLELSADTYFDFDKATLKPAGERKVDEIVRSMKDNPRAHALVEGHTDSIGTDAYNQKLSERRANAVRSYMMSQGIDSGRITTRGYGKSKPVVSNKTAEGRARNRRVVIIIE